MPDELLADLLDNAAVTQGGVGQHQNKVSREEEVFALKVWIFILL